MPVWAAGSVTGLRPAVVEADNHQVPCGETAAGGGDRDVPVGGQARLDGDKLGLAASRPLHPGATIRAEGHGADRHRELRRAGRPDGHRQPHGRAHQRRGRVVHHHLEEHVEAVDPAGARPVGDAADPAGRLDPERRLVDDHLHARLDQVGLIDRDRAIHRDHRVGDRHQRPLRRRAQAGDHPGDPERGGRHEDDLVGRELNSDLGAGAGDQLGLQRAHRIQLCLVGGNDRREAAPAVEPDDRPAGRGVVDTVDPAGPSPERCSARSSCRTSRPDMPGPRSR